MNINKVLKKYLTQGFAIACLLYIIGMSLERIFTMPLGWSLVISFVFSLITLFVYGYGWKMVASSSPKNLTMFYMAGSVMRMIIALPFIVGYWMKSSSFDDTLRFVIVFIIFYLVMLAYDAIYFARVEKNNKKNNYNK